MEQVHMMTSGTTRVKATQAEAFAVWAEIEQDVRCYCERKYGHIGGNYGLEIHDLVSTTMSMFVGLGPEQKQRYEWVGTRGGAVSLAKLISKSALRQELGQLFPAVRNVFVCQSCNTLISSGRGVEEKSCSNPACELHGKLQGGIKLSEVHVCNNCGHIIVNGECKNVLCAALGHKQEGSLMLSGQTVFVDFSEEETPRPFTDLASVASASHDTAPCRELEAVYEAHPYTDERLVEIYESATTAPIIRQYIELMYSTPNEDAGTKGSKGGLNLSEAARSLGVARHVLSSELKKVAQRYVPEQRGKVIPQEIKTEDDRGCREGLTARLV
jgi:hypothetical protein